MDKVNLVINGIDIGVACDLCLDFTDAVKVVNENTENIQFEYINSFSLPYNDDTYKLFKQIGKNRYVSGYLLAPFNRCIEFQFIKPDDKKRRYSAKIKIAISDDIIDCLGNTKLCDIDLGTFEFSTANILSYFDCDNKKDKYNKSNGIVHPIIINCNDIWNGSNGLTTSDIKLAFNPLGVLEKVLQHCKSCFVSPFLSSCRERHRWDLMYKNGDWWNYEGQGLTGEAEISRLTPQLLGGSLTPQLQPIRNNTTNFDNGGNIQPFTAYPSINNIVGYQNNKPSIQCIEMCSTGSVSNTQIDAIGGADEFRLYGVVRSSTGAIVSTEQLDFTAFFFGENDTYSVCYSANLQPNETLTLECTVYGDALILDFNTTTYKVCTKGHYEGDIVPLNQIIDCNITGLDILKEYMIQSCGRVEYNDRTLFMSQPFTTTIQGEKVEGFYRPDHKNIGISVICDSKGGGNVTEKENVRIKKWADSNDDYISDQIEQGNISETEVTNGVGSYTYEIGTNNTKEKKICLQFYQPALNDFTKHIAQQSTVTFNDDTLYIPKLAGETKGIRSFYIYTGQQVINGSSIDLNFNGTRLGCYPTAYQQLPDNVSIINNTDFDRQQLTMQELHEIYCEKWENKTRALSFDTFCKILSLKEYFNLSFRNKYCINYRDSQGNLSTYTGFLQEKKYNSCGKIKEIKFLEDKVIC